MSKSYFQLFFFSYCHTAIPYKVSKEKKEKNVLYIFFKLEKYLIFTSKLLRYLKTSITKKL
jgi:hypothetical protein